MKKLFLILPMLGLTSFVQADWMTDLKQKYQEAKEAWGNIATPREDTTTSNRPEGAASREDAVTSFVKSLGLRGPAAEAESSYTTVKKSNAAAKEFAQEAIRSQDPAKKKQAQALLKEAEQNVAKLEAQEKETLGNLARERADIQKLQAQVSGGQSQGSVLDWLMSLNK